MRSLRPGRTLVVTLAYCRYILSMPLAAGTRLGSYEIRAAIGAGGMGEVYRAHDGKLGRDVAIKVLPESLPPMKSAVTADGERFLMSADLLASGENTGSRPRIVIVQNWHEELKRLVPVK